MHRLPSPLARSFLLSLCPSPCQSPAAFCPRSCLLPADFLAAAGGQLELGAASRPGPPQSPQLGTGGGTQVPDNVCAWPPVHLPAYLARVSRDPQSPVLFPLGPQGGWGEHTLTMTLHFFLGTALPPPVPGGNQSPATEIALSVLLIGLRTIEPSRKPGLPGELCSRYRVTSVSREPWGAVARCQSRGRRPQGTALLAGCGREGCAVCPRVPGDWGLLVRGRFTEGDSTSTIPTLRCDRDSPHTGSFSEPLGPLSPPQGVGVSPCPSWTRRRPSSSW